MTYLAVPPTTNTLYMGSEAEEAKALCKYMQLKHPQVYEHMLHIKNEGKCSLRAGFQANLIGRKKGVPDYFIAIPIGRYHGFWLELKAGKNKPTKDQKVWLGRLAKQDYACVVAWGWEAAAQCIEQYINGQVDRIILEDLVEQ